MAPDTVSYYFQMAQQQQQQNQPGQGSQPQAMAVQQGQGPAGAMQGSPQVIQLQPQQMVNTVAPPPGGIQIVQQIVGPNGEIQQIPIQLTSQQLQMIRAQMTGKVIMLGSTCSIHISPNLR